MSEAKGSDVRETTQEIISELGMSCEGVEFQDGDDIDTAEEIIERRIGKLVEARIQAAAVEMRERCVDAAAQDIQAVITSVGNAIEEFGEKEDLNRALRCALRLIDRLRVIPIPTPTPTPTPALDAMLANERLAGFNKGWEARSKSKDSALDAMLLRARIDEVRQWLMSEGLDKAAGKGETRDWRCKRMAEMERQLAALTQPAPERKEK